MNYCSAMFRDVLLAAPWNLHTTLPCHYLGSRIAVFFEAVSGTSSWVCQSSFIHEAKEMPCVHTALPFTPGFLKHSQCIPPYSSFKHPFNHFYWCLRQRKFEAAKSPAEKSLRGFPARHETEYLHIAILYPSTSHSAGGPQDLALWTISSFSIWRSNTDNAHADIPSKR